MRERNDYVLQQLTSLFESDGVFEVYGDRKMKGGACSRVLLFLMADVYALTWSALTEFEFDPRSAVQGTESRDLHMLHLRHHSHLPFGCHSPFF